MSAEFWFEFASTYSYLAAMRIEELAVGAGVDLRWKPFLLGPIFLDQGWRDSPFNLYPAKGRYMWRDMERLCEHYGLAFTRPSRFPRNGLLAARVACRGEGAPWLADFTRAVYRANFAEDREISEAAVIEEILDGLGQAGVEIIEQAQSDDNKRLLRDQTSEAARLGIFGAPTLHVGGELFWGNDRLEAALAWASRAR